MSCHVLLSWLVSARVRHSERAFAVSSTALERCAIPRELFVVVLLCHSEWNDQMSGLSESARAIHPTSCIPMSSPFSLPGGDCFAIQHGGRDSYYILPKDSLVLSLQLHIQYIRSSSNYQKVDSLDGTLDQRGRFSICAVACRIPIYSLLGTRSETDTHIEL